MLIWSTKNLIGPPTLKYFNYRISYKEVPAPHVEMQGWLRVVLPPWPYIRNEFFFKSCTVELGQSDITDFSAINIKEWRFLYACSTSLRGAKYRKAFVYFTVHKNTRIDSVICASLAAMCTVQHLSACPVYQRRKHRGGE